MFRPQLLPAILAFSFFAAPVFADQAVDPELDIILGDADALHELVIYTSPGCPTCLSDFERKIRPAIEDYVEPGDLRMVFRSLPVLIPRLSQNADEVRQAQRISISMGIAHVCAYRNDGAEAYVASLSAQIEAMHETLEDDFHRFPYLSEPIRHSTILRLMSEAGAFDREAFNVCRESPVQEDIFAGFERNAGLLQQSASISVPAYFLNGEQVLGDHTNAPPRLVEALRETLGEPET